MPTLTLLKLDPTVSPETYELPPDRRLVGNPVQTVWMHYTDPSKQFFVGVWRSEPGKWRIAYTEEEFCHMLEGKSIVTDESGRSVTVVAGESFVMPRGFVGTWEVVDTSTKRFVIYESRTAPAPAANQ
ncbi:MAG: cupin domain-containing protein [Proteobacteria bacterium]|nr:cupin domain-containing protein [Pseudomonadota bacterium]